MLNTITTTSPQLSEQNLTSEQQDAITRLYEHDETLLIAGLGFGKAIVGLTALNQLIDDGVLTKVLVLAPLAVAKLTWGMEPAKWSHITCEVAIATGTRRERASAIESSAQIVVSNFENIDWILSNYRDSFDGLLCDEISRLKGGGSWVKKMRGWVKGLKWRAGMSGTPVAESSMDLYSQMLILDCGKSLGTRKDAFINKYFFPTDYMRYNWELKPDAVTKLSQAMRAVVYVADDEKYKSELPPLVSEIVTVAVPPEVREIYSEIEATSCWGDVEAVNEAVKSSKLQQLAAGGLYSGDDRELVFFNNYKIEAVQAVVSGVNTPIIIVYHFTFEREALISLYPSAPMVGSDFTAEELNDWNARAVPVLLLHWRSGSHGLNLQGGGHTVLHTSPLWSADGYKQVIGRVHRRGQTASSCRRIVLVSAGTVEEKIVEKVECKGRNEAVMMTAIRGGV